LFLYLLVSGSTTIHIGKVLVQKFSDQQLHFLPIVLIYTITDPGAFHGSSDQSQVLKFLQMLGNGGLGKSYLMDQISTDTGVDLEKMLYDGDPGRVAKSFGQERNCVLSIGEHPGF